MSRYAVSPDADQDLIEIWMFITEDNLEAADRIINDIVSKFDLLAQNPKMGRERPDLAPSLRSFPERRYVIFYRPVSKGIEIVRVLHGARDINTILG